MKKLLGFNLVKNKRLRLILNYAVAASFLLISYYFLQIVGAPPPGIPSCKSPDGNEVLHLGFPGPRQLMTRPGYPHIPALYGIVATDTLSTGTFIGCTWNKEQIVVTTSDNALATHENDDPGDSLIFVRADGSLIPQDDAYRRKR